MPLSNTPMLREQLLAELQQLQQDICHYLQQDPVTQYQGLLETLQNRPLGHWPELLMQWRTPELQQKTKRLEGIQAALSQMDMGMYGLCCDCECRIERELLAADPARQRCARCQALLD